MNNRLLTARKHANKLLKEADELLKTTDFLNILKKYGEVSLNGSYKYNLLVDRDLDFGVKINNFSLKLRTDILRVFASKSWAYSINSTDRINFKPLSHLNAPLGFYVCLTIPFPEKRWNIDIWFTLPDEQVNDGLERQILSATPEQLEKILLLKYQAMTSGQKEKGVTSIQIYKQVLGL